MKRKKSFIGWTYEDWYPYFAKGGYIHLPDGTKQERPIDVAEIFTTKQGLADYSTFGDINNTGKRVKITIEDM